MKKFTVVVYREVTERAFIPIEAETKEQAEDIFYDTYSDGIYDDMFEWKDEQVDVTNTWEERDA